MNFYKVFTVVFLVLMVSCGIGPLSGNGTGTDAGEAKIVGFVSLPDNKSGNNVKVTLREQNYIPLSVVTSQQRTATTNANGSFAIDQITAGYYLIELWNDDSLCAIKRFFIPNNTSTVDLGNVHLDKQAAYYGNVLNNGSPASGARLLVMGTDKFFTVAEDGSFSLHLPSGDQIFRVVIENEHISNDFLFSNKDSGDTLFATSTASTMFEDFNEKDSCNNLNKLLGGGWWFGYTDKGVGGNSQVLPTTDLGLIAAIDTSTDAFSGGSLHVIFQIDSTFSAPYSLIGSDISGSKEYTVISKSWFDIRKMTAFTLMAKGSGVVYLQFTSGNTGTPNDYFLFEVPINLTSTWKKYSITPTDIPNAKGSTTSTERAWSVGASAVNNINFLAKKSADFWVDDIRIEGMNPTDFLQN